MEGATELHVLDQVGPLSLVGRDDANLIRFCSRLQQPGGYFLHIGCLSPFRDMTDYITRTFDII